MEARIRVFVEVGTESLLLALDPQSTLSEIINMLQQRLGHAHAEHGRSDSSRIISELRLKQNNALLHFSDTVGAALRDGDSLVAVIGGTPTAPSLESTSVYASNNFTGVPLGQTATPRTSALNDFSGSSSFSASQSTQTASSGVSTPAENWWGAPNDEKRQIWTKEFRHNGLLFPPAYEPHGIPMKYDGQVVSLPAEAEEMASCFARYLETEHVKKPVFCRNFFRDFTLCLKKLKFSQLQIEKFELCDFSDIANHLAQKLEQKRNRTQQERESDKQQQLEKKERYGFVMLDGKKEPLGNYMVEPPGLFLGRGEHPKAGCWKRRITPEDITLNLDESSPIPESPVPGHSWGNVVHQREVSWIAFWTDDLTSTKKYALFSASSSVYARSNRDSFEKARQLKRLIGHIRTTTELELSSPTLKIKQRATAFWFIDRLALRVGSEKDDDTSDTVGCCSLRVKHIKFPEKNRVELDYVGADSMRYINTVTVPDQIFNNLQTFVAGKAPLEPLFELITAAETNSFLRDCAPALTPKILRIYNASSVLQNELQKQQDKLAGLSVEEKIVLFNRANREVAVMCNHVRSVPISWNPEPNIAVYEKKLADMRLVGTADPTAIMIAEAKIEQMKTKQKEREELSTVALGTSKILYIDPRICVAWCKNAQVDLSKIYSKSLRDKYQWAIEEIEDTPNFEF